MNTKTRHLLALRSLEPKQLRGTIQSRSVWGGGTAITAWVDMARELGDQATLIDLADWLRYQIYKEPGRLTHAGFCNLEFEAPQVWEWAGDHRYQYRFKP